MPVSTPSSPVPPMPQLFNTGAPTPTPLPNSQRPATAENVDSKIREMHKRDLDFALPKIRLEVRDLCHPGSNDFLSSVSPGTSMEFAVRRVLDLLYLDPKCPTTTVPGTRSVTLILRSMGGVAYTTSMDLDDDHKEIHFNIDYINGIDKSRKADEILGVLVHEMVHCYQHNAFGTCPMGLIEGIADWVRLNCNLSPPHWKKETSGKWDAGYQHTGYFLDYLERRYGNGTISRMNEKLRTNKYEEKAFWTGLFGQLVEQLWADYQESVEVKETTQITEDRKE